MDLIYVTHPDFTRHDTGNWHPERPARLRAIHKGVQRCGFKVIEIEAPEVDRGLLERVHIPEYVTAIERFGQAGGGELDPDTVMGEHSWSAALHAAGAGVAAADRLQPGQTAFVPTRPPGHHALPDRAMGFCLFNNIAVTARHLVDKGQKVAIVDWDVHHGNGTETIFADEPDVLYLSIHQDPFYPFDGPVESVRVGAVGTVLNLPVPAFTTGDLYHAAFRDLFIPVLALYQPDWILVSCGFDAHADDPLAELRLHSTDYGWFAGQLRDVVPAHRIITLLEGGYHLPAIEESIFATLSGFAGEEFPTPSGHSPDSAWDNLQRLQKLTSDYWDI